MTTLLQVNGLRADTDTVVAKATRALNRFWASLDLSRPESARDALLQFIPELVATYGKVAATVAAAWYEEVRAENVSGRFTATLASTAPVEQIQKGIRYQAGHLFTDDPVFMLATLGGLVQRHVADTGRATIQANAYRDPSRPRYARVPSGKCCAFCSLLAGRGFVYRSPQTAGELNKFHNHDRCVVAASWDRSGISGYDQTHYESLYRTARLSSGASDIRSIVAEMRRISPDSVTDGVVGSG